MRISLAVIFTLVVSHALIGLIGFYAATKLTQVIPPHDYGLSPPSRMFDDVLDGDTVVIKGKAIHVRDMDAPELGPWAKCWAEAALAGDAKRALERQLISGDWKLSDVSESGSGKLSARFLNAKGFDLVDDMRVGGYVAETNQKWDWCGLNANLHPVKIEEKAPRGPRLWWPSGDVYDPRAND